MDELLTRKEAASFMKTSINTLMSWVREGKIPAYKPTKRKVLFKKSELIEFVEGCTDK